MIDQDPDQLNRSSDYTIDSWTSSNEAKEAVARWKGVTHGLLPMQEDTVARQIWTVYDRTLNRLQTQIGDDDLLDDAKRHDLEKYCRREQIIDTDGPAGDFLRLAARSSAFHAFGAFAWLTGNENEVDARLRQGQTSELRNNSRERRDYDAGIATAKMFSVWGIDVFSAAEIMKEIHGRAKSEADQISRLVEVLRQKEIVGAPESYWGQRARQSLIGLVITGLLLIGLVITALVVASNQLQDFRVIENQNTFILIKSSVTMVILFWLLLLVGRIFLGQLQLYSDAKERVVMVQTFLSLVHDRSVDALKDRDLVLRSLFKSGATGVFRDQGDTSAVVNLLNQVSGKSGG